MHRFDSQRSYSCHETLHVLPVWNFRQTQYLLPNVFYIPDMAIEISREVVSIKTTDSSAILG